ncbi:MAG TPA: helix-turn-helix domain-containing protein [Actinopolymorphaceae bacterium]
MADTDELARVLRRARERLQPADVGVPAGPRRRVAGLRREEVAQLAGVSVDYVVRLEQGRGPHPSRSVLAALARALRLDPDARDELFLLAEMPPPAPGRISDVVRLWNDGGATPWRSHRKTIDHPSLGRLTLDCETLHVPDADQAVIVYSAEPGTPEADALALLRVVGTQDMQPQRHG